MEMMLRFSWVGMVLGLFLSSCHPLEDNQKPDQISADAAPVRTWSSGIVNFAQDTAVEQLVTVRIGFPGGTSVLPVKDQWAEYALYRHWLDDQTQQYFLLHGIRSRWYCTSSYSFAEFRFSARQIPESIEKIGTWLYHPVYRTPNGQMPSPPPQSNALRDVVVEGRNSFLVSSLASPVNQPEYLDSVSWYAWHRTHVLENRFFILTTGLSDRSQVIPLTPPEIMQLETVGVRVPAKGGFRTLLNEFRYVPCSDTGTALAIFIPCPARTVADNILYDLGLRYLNEVVRTAWEARFPNGSAPRFIRHSHPESFALAAFYTRDPETALSTVRSALHNLFTASWNTGRMEGIIEEHRFSGLFSRQESLVRLDQYTECLVMNGLDAPLARANEVPNPGQVEKYWKQIPVFWKVAGCGTTSVMSDSVILRPIR